MQVTSPFVGHHSKGRGRGKWQPYTPGRGKGRGKAKGKGHIGMRGVDVNDDTYMAESHEPYEEYEEYDDDGYYAEEGEGMVAESAEPPCSA